MSTWIARFREPSTYAGLAALLGVFGVPIAPDLMQPVIQAGTGLAAVAAIVLREPGAK